MPRVARDISETNIYHIMSRALNKQTLYDDEQDFLYFLKVLKDVKTKTHFDLYAYCVMTNHYHLLIKEHDVNISVIMNKINSRYAKYLMTASIVKVLTVCRIYLDVLDTFIKTQ